MRPDMAVLLLCLACTPYIPERSRIDAITAAAGTIGDERRVPGVEDVGWLRGCWIGRMGASVVEEIWSAPAAGTMLGMSRTMRGDSTTGHEVMLISIRNDHLVLDATPHGQGTTSFAATRVERGHAVFENPRHDFPRRIRYRASAPDSLRAWLDAPGTSGPTIEIVMSRTACPA